MKEIVEVIKQSDLVEIAMTIGMVTLLFSMFFLLFWFNAAMSGKGSLDQAIGTLIVIVVGGIVSGGVILLFLGIVSAIKRLQ